MFAVKPPLAVDLIEQFIGTARARIACQATLKARLELLWSLAKAARDLASQDVWEVEFKHLADELGLTAHRLIQNDGIEHVLRWAWRGWNPFR